MQEKIQIRLLNNTEALPYSLLLLADETIEAINRYVFNSDVYLAQINEKNIGVFCLFKENEKTIEIKNIAIAEEYQGLGLGSFLIKKIKEIVKYNYQAIIVGTPDIATKQINFYEKNGFVKFDIRKNFFVINYSKPIFENDMQLKDMVLLKLDL